MPGWFPAPRAGLALGDDTSGPLVDLFALADSHRWLPFEASRRFLGVRWGGRDSPWGSSRVRGLLRLFADMRWIEVTPGDRVDPQRIRCLNPREAEHPDWCVVAADAVRCVAGVEQLAAVARMASAGVFDSYANIDQIGRAATRTTSQTTTRTTPQTTTQTTESADAVGAYATVQTTSRTTPQTTTQTTTQTKEPEPDSDPDSENTVSPVAERLLSLLLGAWHDGPDDRRLGSIEGTKAQPSLADWCETMVRTHPRVDLIGETHKAIAWETSRPPAKRKKLIRPFLAGWLNRPAHRHGDTTHASSRQLPRGAHNGRSQSRSGTYAGFGAAVPDPRDSLF